MLLSEKLVRVNFRDGVKRTSTVFKKQDVYLENRFKVLSAGALGYGVLQGYRDSLSLDVANGILVVRSGAAIDQEGNLIFVPEAETVKDKVAITDFPRDQYLYIYIRYQEEESGIQSHAGGSEHGKVHTELLNSYVIDVSNHKHHRESEWIELGRIYIDYTKINQYNQHDISNSLNPFLPRENEIDRRYIPKIITNLADLEEENREEIYKILGYFADYLNEISFRYKLLSATTASSFAYQIREDIFNNIMTPYSLYYKLKSLLDIVVKIKDENSKIQESDFWINISNLMGLFSENYGSNYKGEIDFYGFNLEENSYFGNIIKHFRRAAECNKELNLNVKEKVKVKAPPKRFVQVGRSDKKEHGNDIYFLKDKTISRVHLRVTAYRGGFMIEDLRSANGTFVNAERIRHGIKKFVRPSTDIIVMGKNGTTLNLNDPKIQNLLNL